MSREQIERTEVKPEIVFLGKLVERVASGKMRVPKFQRPFVWRHEDMKSLLDSVLKGYPIGSILVWETERKVSSLDKVGPIPIDSHPEGIVAFVLDGHQRISTLVGTLLFREELKSDDDDVDWMVYCDLETLEFIHQPRQGLEPHHFPVRSLLSTSGFLEACRELQGEIGNSSRAARLLKTADALANAIRNYQLPLISITDANLDSAVSVFARLNRRGRKMTADQMVSALTYREGEFHLAQRLDEIEERLSHRGFGNLDRTSLLRTVLAAIERDIYAKDFADLLVKEEIRKQLPKKLDEVETSIGRALDFLESLGVTSDRVLPYGLQMVLLAEFFRLCPVPDSSVRALLERWFWVSSFTGWFAGATSTKARLVLDEMRRLARGEGSSLDVVDLELPAQPFPERFDARSARVRAFLLYLVSLEPRSMDNPDELLDSGALLSEFGPGAIAHIVSAGLPDGLASSPANRMFADRRHRGQTIGRLEAMVDGRGELGGQLLASHGFPREATPLIRSGDREGVIRKRLDALIDGERKFMRARHVSLPLERTGIVYRDSDTSEED